MELHTQPHYRERRMLDWLIVSVAGLVGGALVIVFEFFWSIMVLNESPWRPTRKIAAMTMDRDAPEETSLFSFSIVGTMLALHFALGVLMGMILGVIIAPFYLDSNSGMFVTVGVVFGIVVYAVNFHGMTAVFPWFVSECGSGPLLANLLFGVVTTITYGMLERRMPEPMH